MPKRSEEELKAMRRAYSKKYRDANKEKVRAYAASYHESHKDDEAYKQKARDRASNWREEYPDREKANTAAYYRKNAEALKSYAAEWRAQNAEFLSQYFVEHYAKNSDKVKVRVAEYRKENPEKCRAQGHNKRARKRENGGKLSSGIVYILLSEQGGKCCYCDVILMETGMHLDHYIPTALGGPNEDWNVQLLCPTCNCKKNAKHPLDFLRLIGLPSTRELLSA